MKIVQLITLAAGSLFFLSCQTPGGGSVITPARIEAVTALGAYFGAKTAIEQGKRGEIERSLAGLKSIQASGKADLPAVIKAIGDSGISLFGSAEGSLALGAILTFTDLWSGKVQPILDDDRARAVLAGMIRGFDLALAPAERGAPDIVANRLTMEAVAQRK